MVAQQLVLYEVKVASTLPPPPQRLYAYEIKVANPVPNPKQTVVAVEATDVTFTRPVDALSRLVSYEIAIAASTIGRRCDVWVWDGTVAIPACLFLWDGAVEIPLSKEIL